MVHTGGMVALVPSLADAARLAVAGGEDAAELHLTLAFLGDDVTGWPPATAARAVADLHELAAAASGPLTGQVFARAEFNHGDDTDRDVCSVYLVGDLPELDGLRQLADAWARGQPDVPPARSPFIAHITAGYGISVDALTYTGPVVFDRMRLALGGHVTDVPVGPAILSEPVADIDNPRIAGRPSAFSIEGAPPVAESGAQFKADPAAPPAEPAPKRTPGKRYVASQAGAARYGKPIGTELGKSRGGKAADDAQNDQGAKDKYAALMAMPAARRAKHVASLSDDDLKALSAVTYSFKSSNAEVVAARNAMASALRKRGFDPGEHGSLAGKTRAKAGTAAAAGAGQAKDKPKTKGSMSDVEDRAWRREAAGKGGRLLTDDLTDAAVKKLLAAGWKGKAGDGAEALYPPQKGLDMDDVEVKRTTTKPWESRTAQRGGKTIGADKSDEKGGGDEYPIKTIGDVAAAIKKAKAIKDPERLKTVRAHIRAGAAKINASNMIPKDWSGGGKADGKKKPNPFAKKALDDLAEDIEFKFMSPDPRARKLRSYWAHGAGRAKWNTFRELRAHLGKYVPPRMLNGLTANIYKLGKGHWPGAGRGEKAAGVELELTVLSPAELKAAATMMAGTGAGVDDDDVDAALDGHAATEITSEDAYERALADEIEWETAADGEIAVADDDPAEWDDPEWDGVDGPDDEGEEAEDGTSESPEEEAAEAAPDTEGDEELAALEALFAFAPDETDEVAAAAVSAPA